MRTKRIYAVLLTVFMLIMLLPISTQAVSNPGLNFTLDASDPAYPGNSGAGWLWDADSKLLTLNGLSLVKNSDLESALMLPDGSTIEIEDGSDNVITNSAGSGITCYGSMQITGHGSLTISSSDNGIRVVGDLTISDLVNLDISSDNMGMRVGPGKESQTGADGNLTITDCKDIKIDSTDDGMRVSGNLFINQVDFIEIHTDESENYNWATGMRVGPGDGCGSSGAAGDAVISNVGQMTIVTNERGGSGLRITGNLLMDNINQVDITSHHTGVRVGPGGPDLTTSPGNIEIIDCTEINITSTAHTGIRATGNLTVDSVDMLSIKSDHIGMRIGSSNYIRTGSSENWSTSDAEGYVNIINSEVDISSTQAGIRSNGAIWTYQSALKVSDMGEELVNDYGLYSTKGGITIERSSVDVSAYAFALVTGNVCGDHIEGTVGGNIVIVQSYVKALVDSENGMAAIFAGDNLEPGADGHARIILEKAFISVPDEAYIVDVQITPPVNGIDIRLGCQSITGDPEVEVITSLDQTLNYVEIEPYFYVNYNPNGGTGEMPDEGPYTSGASIVLKDSGFVKEGYLFTGWNTAADGSGTIYLPGQEIPLSDNLTLYAQYEPILYDVIYDANGGAGYVIDENSPYMIGSTVTVMVNIFTKEGYVFTRWNTSADGSGTAYLPGDTFVIEADTTLFAQYAEDIHIVEPEDDDIDVDEDEQEKEPIPKTGDTDRLHGRIGIVLLLAGLLIVKKRSVTKSKC